MSGATIAGAALLMIGIAFTFFSRTMREKSWWPWTYRPQQLASTKNDEINIQLSRMVGVFCLFLGALAVLDGMSP